MPKFPLQLMLIEQAADGNDRKAASDSRQFALYDSMVDTSRLSFVSFAAFYLLTNCHIAKLKDKDLQTLKTSYESTSDLSHSTLYHQHLHSNHLLCTSTIEYLCIDR